MCGRFTLTITLEELMLRYMLGDTDFAGYGPRYNIAPGQQVFAIIHDGLSNRLGELRWGLIPPWSEQSSIGYQMINARAESAADKRAFAEPLRRKRCLIPADGFYEWKKTENGKQAMRITRTDRAVFSMAGLYETWYAPDGQKISSFAIVTTVPNQLVEPIHDRMPVILEPEDEALWLDRTVNDPAELLPLLRPYNKDKLEAYAVSPAVGNVRHDDPSLLEPYDAGEQLTLW